MSDFGSFVAVYRCDGADSSASDEERIRAAARSLQFVQRDRIGPYDEFDLVFGLAQNAEGVEGVSVRLSGYFVGDDEGNEGLEPEVILGREGPVAERFAEELAKALGGEYRCDSYSGYW